MAKKRTTLPKDFDELIKSGDISALKAVFDKCELDARGYNKETALHFYNVPDELVRWLVEQGLNINSADHYGKTPLHKGAANIRLLVELGADINAVAGYEKQTPLHYAAHYHRVEDVRILLEHGANILAKDSKGNTPLAHSLAVCQPIDIEKMAEISQLLLNAGTPVTKEMSESVTNIGEQFEFYRDKFNPDYLPQTDAALLQLYEIYNIPPVPKRRIHDGVSPITVTATTWQKQHTELWNYLVPGSGKAKTVQGEVIRIIGKVSREILDNGGGNWCGDHKKMLDALLGHLGSGMLLPELREAEDLVKMIYNGDGDNEIARLTELSVKWVLLNPKPVALGKVGYKR